MVWSGGQTLLYAGCFCWPLNGRVLIDGVIGFAKGILFRKGNVRFGPESCEYPHGCFFLMWLIVAVGLVAGVRSVTKLLHQIEESGIEYHYANEAPRTPNFNLYFSRM